MFLSFEGIDCCGKSTQIALLRTWIHGLGKETQLLREPGGTVISEHIRSLLLDPAHRAMDPVAETLLFSAARAQVVAEVIQPALAAGHIVIADRFFDSTTAYQGFGRGLPIDRIRALNVLATSGLSPHMTFLIDISVEESQRRATLRAQAKDRMETSDSAFFSRIREGYLRLAEEEPARFRIIAGEQPPEEIAARIRQELATVLL